MIFGLALIAVAVANGHGGHGGGGGHGSSWVSRHEDHGHHTEISHGGHGGGGGGHGGDSHGHGHEGGGHGSDSHGHGGGGGGGGHDYYHHPSYKYEYGAVDAKTGHQHSAWEHRDGDTVHGEYSLDEADGTKRIVTYSSNKKTGFTAHVQKIGHAHHDGGHGGGHGGGDGGHGHH